MINLKVRLENMKMVQKQAVHVSIGDDYIFEAGKWSFSDYTVKSRSIVAITCGTVYPSGLYRAVVLY